MYPPKKDKYEINKGIDIIEIDITNLRGDTKMVILQLKKSLKYI